MSCNRNVTATTRSNQVHISILEMWSLQSWYMQCSWIYRNLMLLAPIPAMQNHIYNGQTSMKGTGINCDKSGSKKQVFTDVLLVFTHGSTCIALENDLTHLYYEITSVFKEASLVVGIALHMRACQLIRHRKYSMTTLVRRCYDLCCTISYLRSFLVECFDLDTYNSILL